MTTNNTATWIFVGAALVGASYFYWHHSNTTRPATNALVIADRSSSSDSTERDQAILHVFDQFVKQVGSRSDAIFTVLVTGTEETAYEPVRIFSTPIPARRALMEGKSKTQKQIRELREVLQKELARWDSSAPVSPIMRAFARGVEELRGSGCDTGANCNLVIRSDGLDNVDDYFTRSIAKGRSSPKWAPQKIDLRGINSVWCGTAELSRNNAPTKGIKPEFVLSLIKAYLKNPDELVFQPFCDVSNLQVSQRDL
jgi:hypothetical protein